jgi:hypothetical protein
MQRETPHYGDILRKVKQTVLSCQTLDQLRSARRFAQFFYFHCRRTGLNEMTVGLLTTTVENIIEDKWVDLTQGNLNTAITE